MVHSKQEKNGSACRIGQNRQHLLDNKTKIQEKEVISYAVIR